MREVNVTAPCAAAIVARRAQWVRISVAGLAGLSTIYTVVLMVRLVCRLCRLAAATVLTFLYAASTAHADSRYILRADHWSPADERAYEQFIQAIGQSDCASLDACLHSLANPFYGSDPPSHHFATDCAQLPYVLRFYFAWKRGLPFSYVDHVTAHGESKDDRYSPNGNQAVSRRDVPSGRFTGYQIIDQIRASVSSANYRIAPDQVSPVAADFYAPEIKPGSIRPGTMIYDPAGHVAVVYRIDPDGEVHSFDAHTDFSLTEITFDERFARTRPAQGAGFKNWRPLRMENGKISASPNTAIADFSLEQFYGTGPRPKDSEWASGRFTLNGETLGYYDFIRARLAGGKLLFDPVKEIEEQTQSLCSDLRYRAGAVEMARAMAQRPHPQRLPTNIYGTDGDWEMFSTPSRDARLKTAFKALRDKAGRFVAMGARDSHLEYHGSDLAADMLDAYRKASRSCFIAYRKSDGTITTLSFEMARQRLFALSFDPYDCPERRWGASSPDELASCSNDGEKERWYAAEQNLRNQIERTYDARMDFSLEALQHSAIGAPAVPDTDIEGFLAGTVKTAAY